MGKDVCYICNRKVEINKKKLNNVIEKQIRNFKCVLKKVYLNNQ